MQHVCPQCGKQSAEESPQFCSGCGTRMDGGLPAADDSAPPRPQKDGMTASYCSSFLPGLGQVYNGETAKGVILLILTIAGLIFFLIPGILVWLWAMHDAWVVAGRMNAGEIEFRETRMLPMVTFVIFAVVLVLGVLIIAITLLVTYMIAALGPLSTAPGSIPMDRFYKIILP